MQAEGLEESHCLSLAVVRIGGVEIPTSFRRLSSSNNKREMVMLKVEARGKGATDLR